MKIIDSNKYKAVNRNNCVIIDEGVYKNKRKNIIVNQATWKRKNFKFYFYM